MADGVPITAGAGTTIATDDAAAAGHVQIIKLAISADGSATVIPADATDGLLVNLSLAKAEDAAHSSGDKGIMLLAVRNDTPTSRAGTDGDYTPIAVDQYGQQSTFIRRDTVRIAVQSGGLTTATTAYTAGDQVGTQFTLAGAARLSGGTGRIRSVLLTSAQDAIGAFDVVFLRASITLAADNAAFAISDSDARSIVQMVQLTGAYDIGNNRICVAYNLDIPYDCSGGTSLYAALITRAGHTFFGATTDLELVVFVERD